MTDVSFYSSEVSPTAGNERITLLDSLRGIAVLGILLMNIPFFGLPDPAGDSPLVLNETGTVNETIFLIVKGFLDGTQRAIFSMLFGAGVILFISRLEKRMTGMSPADYFVKRQLWLVLFGLFNAYVLLWAGDVLFAYGICGIILFPFRRLPAKWLFVAAGICLLLMTIRENVSLYREKNIIEKGETAMRIRSSSLTPEQVSDKEAALAMKQKNSVEGLREDYRKNLQQIRGNYSVVYDFMKDLTMQIELSTAYNEIWDILVFMFIGMAFFKSGILTGEAPVRVYFWMTLIALSLGIALSCLRMSLLTRYHYDMYDVYKNRIFSYFELARTFRSLGLFGLIMLLFRSGLFKWLFALMRPVGQMAFTNYLTQSVICNLFFLGIGFGMIGKLDRKEIYIFVLFVWLLQILWSHIWLRFFRFGPLEWCWRSLTYWKLQKFRADAG